MSVSEGIASAIKSNPKCHAGLLCQCNVFDIDVGPSGGPELLALLYADEQHLSYWYGHVRRHEFDHGMKFVALIARLTVLVNASTAPLLFKRFNYWTKVRHEYGPCTIQYEDDAFACAVYYVDAVALLEKMITRFDLSKRFPEEGSPYESDPLEMRALDVFGLQDFSDADGSLPAPPMQTPLRLVKGCR